MTTEERFDQLHHSIAEINTAIASNNVSLSQINLQNQRTDERFQTVAANFEKVRDSLRSLEVIAETLLESARKHDEVIVNLEKQWQAYLTTLPQN